MERIIERYCSYPLKKYSNYDYVRLIKLSWKAMMANLGLQAQSD